MKSQIVVLAHYHSEVEPDGTVESNEVGPPFLLGVQKSVDEAVESIANLFAAHQARMDREVVDERLSYVTLCSQTVPTGVQVSFYDFSGTVAQITAKIRKYVGPFARQHEVRKSA